MQAEAELVLAQTHRFSRIDPLLPAARPVAEGLELAATLPDGDRVAGWLRAPATGQESWVLSPVIGDRGTGGMDAILRAARAALDGAGPASSCTVTWPSRDAEATRALLDHGFAPSSALAVRTERGKPVSTRDSVRIRTRNPRPGTLVLDADLAGTPAGTVTAVEIDASLGAELPRGRWGLLRELLVPEAVRRRGAGSALMAAAHAGLGRSGIGRSYLVHDAHDPVTTVFLHRQGYRPLWTTWTARPLSVMR
ncbi:GNAT family N-acetyltransferase [Saccharomonospora sp. NPDC006951]